MERGRGKVVRGTRDSRGRRARLGSGVVVGRREEQGVEVDKGALGREEQLETVEGEVGLGEGGRGGQRSGGRGRVGWVHTV